MIRVNEFHHVITPYGKVCFSKCVRGSVSSAPRSGIKLPINPLRAVLWRGAVPCMIIPFIPLLVRPVGGNRSIVFRAVVLNFLSCENSNRISCREWNRGDVRPHNTNPELEVVRCSLAGNRDPRENRPLRFIVGSSVSGGSKNLPLCYVLRKRIFVVQQQERRCGCRVSSWWASSRT